MTNLERIISLTIISLLIDRDRKLKRGRYFLVEKDYTKCSNQNTLFNFFIKEIFIFIFFQSCLQNLEAVMKNTKKVNLFFIAFCEDEAKQARYFLNKYKICLENNLISEPSEIHLIYEKLYDTLENNLFTFLSELQEVTSIQREVATKSEISELMNKLHARKKKTEPIMTDLCRQKILYAIYFNYLQDCKILFKP